MVFLHPADPVGASALMGVFRQAQMVSPDRLLRADRVAGLELGLRLERDRAGTLPAVSVVVVTFGFWALGMRGLMITVQGEDYVQLAKAKG